MSGQVSARNWNIGIEGAEPVRCPARLGSDIRCSCPASFDDAVMRFFSREPYQCRRCGRQFYPGDRRDKGGVSEGE